MRLGWLVVNKLIELGFDGAIALDRWLDGRARKKRGLSYKDVAHQQAQIAAATRVIPGRKKNAAEYR